MKKNFLILSIALLGLFVSVPTTWAAFPVSVSQSSTAAPTEAEPQVAPQVDKEAEKTEVSKKALKKDVKKAKKTLLQHLAASGGGSQLIALLLAVFVGGIGIHRFYLGYTWQGVVQLLTLGGCGIWSLIDLIRIITGDLQPKNGSYDKTL